MHSKITKIISSPRFENGTKIISLTILMSHRFYNQLKLKCQDKKCVPYHLTIVLSYLRIKVSKDYFEKVGIEIIFLDNPHDDDGVKSWLYHNIGQWCWQSHLWSPTVGLFTSVTPQSLSLSVLHNYCAPETLIPNISKWRNSNHY